jgi:thiol:disulfide interchange protein
MNQTKQRWTKRQMNQYKATIIVYRNPVLPMPLITHLSSRNDMLDLIRRQRNGTIKTLILKLGATWCGPCRAVDPLIMDACRQTSSLDDVTWVVLDVDEDGNSDVYSYFKKMRQVNGIPAVLVWHLHINQDTIPDRSVTGADEVRLVALFRDIFN